MKNMQNLLLISANVLLIVVIVFLYFLLRQTPLVSNNQSDTLTLTPTQTITAQSSSDVSTSGETWYVSPMGKNTHDGKSASTPFATIQHALDLAQPGDVISLTSGTYMQDVISKRNGRRDAPITLSGPTNAILKGSGGARIVEINHDHIVLKGFTIDGLAGAENTKEGYRDKLLYVHGKEKKKGVTGLKVLNMTLKNGGGECIRLRYFAQENEIAHTTIHTCGAHDFKFGDGGKNGEAIYIGTAPEQLTDGKNPTTDPDESTNNWVHHNKIDTQGNECVDIKESSTKNIIEFNTCTGQKDPNSGGMDSRGENNTFRNNEIRNSIGAGIRLGGDGNNQGIQNHVYNNVIKDNTAGGIKFQRFPQGKICGNTMSGNTNGNSVGDFGSRFSPTQKCSG